MVESFVFTIPPWPDYVTGNYRRFRQGENHVTRICKEFVLIFMLESTLYFSEDGKPVSVRPGEWYMQIPGLKQEGRKGSPAPFYYFIHFQASGQADSNNGIALQSHFNTSGNIRNLTLPVRGNFDKQYFKPLFDQLDSLSSKRISDISGSQAIFFNILARLANSGSTSTEGIQGLILQVMDYLARNYNKSVTCEDLSENFHFTTDYLTRKMKEYAGTTPWQYIQKVRVDKAMELLSNTDYTMSYIANSIGYDDLSVFYKAFKKLAGTAPGIWRRINRGLH